jgi:hypothetical protein
VIELVIWRARDLSIDRVIYLAISRFQSHRDHQLEPQIGPAMTSAR